MKNIKKKLTVRILTIFLAICLLFVGTNFYKNTQPSTVRAFGDLTVNFHVGPGLPIFTVTNMAPGDMQDRNVDVTNGSSVARLVAVKGARTGGVGADPKIETVLDIVIKDGATPVYGNGSPTGPKTVFDFFTDSTTTNGVMLDVINPTQSKTYNFAVTFPTSAGNDFQNKSVIFDLTFGDVISDNVVINEVYYKVDPSHGLDSPKDRGITVNGNNVTLTISGNGAGSTNKITVNINQACQIIQQNNTNSNVNVNVSSTTGGNSANNNTGGNTNVKSGSSNASVNVNVGGSSNSASGCGNKLGQNDEWVELYNPTDNDISLKNWTLSDNSGTTKINANKTIKAGKFALLAKSASTFTTWNTHGALIVELGSQIGDGLDNGGDHLILKNNTSVEVDRMSWGTDTSGFTPPATNPEVALGHSTERIAPGFDTNMVGDWHDQNPPTPGL